MLKGLVCMTFYITQWKFVGQRRSNSVCSPSFRVKPLTFVCLHIQCQHMHLHNFTPNGLELTINEASPFRVSLHTSCTGAQKRRSQNETMIVLSPSTLSFEQRYSLNHIQELNMTTYLDGLPDQFNLMFSFPEMGPKHVGR